MPSIRNKSGQSLYVPVLGRDVDADEVVEVSADLVDGLTCQSIWEDATAASASTKKTAASA